MLELNTKQIADLLGVTERQIANYKRGSNPIPVIINHGGNRGTVFDGHEVLKWWLSRKVKSSNNDCIDPQLEKAKLDRARRELAEIDRDAKLKRLLDSDEVAKAWEKIILDARAKFMAIPSKYDFQIMNITDQKAANIILNKMVRDVLTELGSGE